MKKILVPTDFSAHANSALYAAASLAKKCNAEVILLHIIELPQQATDEISVGAEIPEVMFFKNAAENRLTQIALSPILQGLTVSKVLQLGRTFHGVNKVAEVNEVDLIVMGSHGASGAKEMFIGSNTEKVVRSSDIPVLVIKEKMESFEVKNFIFASDFSLPMKDTFTKALKFNKVFGSKLHLLMINTPNNFKTTQDAENQFETFLADVPENDFELIIFNDHNIEKGILNYAKKIDADLISLSTHGRKGISHFLNGSITEDLVNHSTTSVLTFKIN